MKLPFWPQTKETQDDGEPFTWVTPADAKALLEGGQTILIDVREPWEYSSGHIPGARNIPLRAFLRQARQELTGDSVMFVCAVGERSAVACEMAASLGVAQVYNLRGGVSGWDAQGYPLER